MTDKPSIEGLLASILGPCIDHRHKQVGRCVYCDPCGRRLYQGQTMTTAELDAIRQAVNGGQDSQGGTGHGPGPGTGDAAPAV